MPNLGGFREKKCFSDPAVRILSHVRACRPALPPDVRSVSPLATLRPRAWARSLQAKAVRRLQGRPAGAKASPRLAEASPRLTEPSQMV